jgi:hypothetical protein
MLTMRLIGGTKLALHASPSPNTQLFSNDFDAPPTKISLATTPALSPLPNAAPTSITASPGAAHSTASSFSPTGAASNWDPWSDEPAPGETKAPSTPAKVSANATTSAAADPFDTNDFGFAGSSPLPAPLPVVAPTSSHGEGQPAKAAPVVPVAPVAPAVAPAAVSSPVTGGGPGADAFDFEADPWAAAPTFTPSASPPPATPAIVFSPVAATTAPPVPSSSPPPPKPANLAAPSAAAGTDSNKWAAGFAAEAGWADDF